MAKKLNVGIIGSGYSGMAAAVALSERGIPVTVFESAKQLGGRARGLIHHNTQIDNGQHLLLGCYRETLSMIEKVGGNIDQDFLSIPLQIDLHNQFSLKAPRLPAPLHLFLALLNAQGLTWRERFKASRFMLTLRNMNFRLSSDMTVTKLLQIYGQNENLRLKLWGPLCIAALNTPIDKASAQVMLNVLHDSLNQTRTDSDMLLPRIDFTELFPQRAATHIKQRGNTVLTSCGVSAIRPNTHSIELTTASNIHTFSHVICAAPPVISANFLRPLQAFSETVAQIDELKHQPIYTLYLQYPKNIKLPNPMIGLHQCCTQWLFDKGQISGQHGLLVAVISAEGIHQELPQDELAIQVTAELHKEFGIADAPIWIKVIAEKRATFCCSPNLRRPSQQTAHSSLMLAGDYTAGEYPATLEGAVISGLKCAQIIAP